MNIRWTFPTLLSATLLVDCSHMNKEKEENETVMTMDQVPPAVRDALKREAARRDLPYQTLIRMWLRERLEAEA